MMNLNGELIPTVTYITENELELSNSTVYWYLNPNQNLMEKDINQNYNYCLNRIKDTRKTMGFKDVGTHCTPAAVPLCAAIAQPW
jgi:hypothetical protein